MWSLFRKDPEPVVGSVAVAEPETEELPVPQPVFAVEADMTAEEFAAYEAIAVRVGLDKNPALRADKLAAVLAEENIRTYNKTTVFSFMDQKYGKDWSIWGLRKSDAEVGKGWVVHPWGTEDKRSKTYSDSVYGGAVPLPVLMTIDAIVAKVPDAVFHVWAPGDANADPFLHVWIPGSKSYIIERWDEPDFREK